MLTLNDLCNSALAAGTATESLRHACSLPRSGSDMSPLPEPHAESAFDSSWENLLAGVDLEDQPAH